MPEEKAPAIRVPDGYRLVPVGPGQPGYVATMNDDGRRAELENEDLVWVISNRVDDRVVLHEFDPRHPEGGWAVVGGPAPALVARTPAVEARLREGLMVTIPEPPDSKRKPLVFQPLTVANPLNQPGQPVQLGRKLDTEIVPEQAQRSVREQQAKAGRELAVPTQVRTGDAEMLANRAREQRALAEQQDQQRTERAAARADRDAGKHE